MTVVEFQEGLVLGMKRQAVSVVFFFLRETVGKNKTKNVFLHVF